MPHKLSGWLVLLTASAFSQRRQYANSPGDRAYFYAEKNSPFLPSGNPSAHFTYPQRDDQAELSVTCYRKK